MKTLFCELLSALALIISLIALYKSESIKIEVVETKLAKKKEKVRKRYVVTLVLSEDPNKIEKECLDDAVKRSVKEVYGTLGLAIVNPKVVYLDGVTKAAIIRTTLEGVKVVTSSLMALDEACGTRVNLIPFRAFGTLASAREKLPKLNKYVKYLE